MKITKRLSKFVRNSLFGICLVSGIGGLESRLDAKDIFVPGQYSKIQDAIDSPNTVAGDRVLVASGTYMEQVSLKSGITVQGEDRETTEIWYSTTAVKANSIKDASIKGFTIGSGEGDGIYAYNSDIEVRDNIIKDSANGNGVYVWVRDSSNRIGVINNLIKGNKRGIYYLAGCDWASVIKGEIWNNLIWGNTDEGILLETTSSCDWRFDDKCEPYIVNNVIYENLDGIRLKDSKPKNDSTPYISNNIIAKNKKGFGINNSEMTPAVAFNNVWENSGGDYGNVTVGPGSISQDPKFVNPGSAGDFHLQADSPCIDAGRPTNAPLEDIDMDVRPQCRDYDIGVDEYVYPAVKFKRGDTNFSGSVNIADAVCILSYLFGSGASSGDCKDKYTKCRNAFDTNADRTSNIADAIKVLGHLFGNEGNLPEPFMNCGNGGNDSTKYSLGCGCDDYPPCN